MKKITYKNKVCYTCEVCGFAYEDKKVAEECEEWCRKHHSCNFKFAKKAVNFKK